MSFENYYAAKAAVLAHRDERDWKKFHNALDLALNLSLEAHELMAHFLWLQGEEIAQRLTSHRDKIGAELADVLYSVILLAEIIEHDPASQVAFGYCGDVDLALDFPAMAAKLVADYDHCGLLTPASAKSFALELGKLAVKPLDLLSSFEYPDEASIEAQAKLHSYRLGRNLNEVLIRALILSGLAGLDLLAALETKMAENARKYPVDQSRGKNNKYTDYQS